MTSLDLITAFETVADAPEGIDRLRELVLQLAVRGKLVAQDSKDEAAIKLLARIAEEKTRLVKDGKARKDREWPLEEAQTQPYPLPDGWVWTTTAALGFVNPRNDADDAVRVSFAPMPVIPKEYRSLIKPESRQWSEVKKGFTHFADGDVAVAKITPCFQNLKSCVMQGLLNGIGAGTTELLILRPIPGLVDPRYLLAFFKSPDFVAGGVATMTGTAGQQRVSNDYFAFRPFPIPPLPEQHRIVARVDELMGLLDKLEAAHKARNATRTAGRDAALAALRDAGDANEVEAAWKRIAGRLDDLCVEPEDVKPMRDVVLGLAIRGRLVAQDQSEEHAGITVKKAAREKAQRTTDGRIGRNESLPPVSNDEVSFQPAAGWVWTRLQEVCEIAGGMAKGRKLEGVETVELPYLRVANVQAGALDLSVVKTIPVPVSELERYKLEPGDVLLTEGGDWDKLGRSAIWDGEIETCIHQNHIFRARHLVPEVAPLWLSMFTNSADGRAYFQSCSKQTTNLASINKTQLRNCPIPLPPAAEQHRIVAKVHELMALLDRLEEKLRAARETQAAFAAAAVHQLDTSGPASERAA